MTYVDTSVLVPLFIPEAASARVRAEMLALAAGEAALSDWTILEFASALGARVRGGTVRDSIGREAIRALDAMVTNSFVRLAPLGADYKAAQHLVQEFSRGLRAGDALHLAIAARHGARLLSLDRKLVAAARSAGVRLART